MRWWTSDHLWSSTLMRYTNYISRSLVWHKARTPNYLFPYLRDAVIENGPSISHPHLEIMLCIRQKSNLSNSLFLPKDSWFHTVARDGEALEGFRLLLVINFPLQGIAELWIPTLYHYAVLWSEGVNCYLQAPFTFLYSICWASATVALLVN